MTMNARFDGTCKRCGVHFTKGTEINWSRGWGATHATVEACGKAIAAANAAPVAPSVRLDMSPVADFILAAKERGVKFPSVSFLAPDGGELRLKVSGATATEPGAVNVLVNDQWLGRINPTGEVVGRLRTYAAVLETLTKIATDPAGMAKAYGALTGHCSFCNRKLTDAGSVEVGYGPTCAKAFGLPHTAKGTPTLAPVEALAVA